MKKILIMGLPGAGKTTLAQELIKHLESVEWFNADDVRQRFDDWDFSEAGRIRQSQRMRQLADASLADYVICDFVAPLVEMRNHFAADYIIWMDTVQTGRFEDTNKVFDAPEHYHYRIQEKAAEKWAKIIADDMAKDCRHANS